MRRFDLVAWDVDGTLVESAEGLTVWEVFNRHYLGTHEVNRERFARYLRGELTYGEWVALDVEGWRAAGATRTELEQALAALRLVSGARETLGALRDTGAFLAVISGTLDLVLDTLWPDHPFHRVHTNRLRFDASGRLAGWEATPYDMEGKAAALRTIAAELGIELARTAYVGDSVNDVWIAREAGFTVAWNPRSAELERLAGAVVRGHDLRDVLPWLIGSPADPRPARSGSAEDSGDRTSPGPSAREASRSSPPE